MAMRTIVFHAGVDSVSPSTSQFAGVQGDHGATDVTFALDTALVSGSYLYRVEFVDGMNNFDTTENIPLASGKSTITVPLIGAWTGAGGTGEVRLVISKLNADSTESIKLYTLVGRVYFETRAGMESGESALERGLTTLIVTTNQAKTEATQAANAAGAAASSATAAANQALTAATTADNATAGALSAKAATQAVMTNAIGATDGAKAAMALANNATAAATTAAANANKATAAANTAASGANTAASSANTAAISANAAKANADTATAATQSATTAANKAASAANASAINADSTAQALRAQAQQGAFNGVNGVDGHGLSVLGMMATLSELQAVHPIGERGEVYAIGTPTANELVVWNAITMTWQNIGNVLGGWTMNDLCIDAGDWTSGTGGWMMDSLCMDAGDWDNGSGGISTLAEHEADTMAHSHMILDGNSN